MLHTNLSTRPFYNERAAQVGLGVLAVVVLAFTVFNVIDGRALSARHRDLLARVGGDERAAAALREQADRARQSLNREELDRVDAAAREANGLIDRRVFSWTTLLDTVEATIPPGVRVLSLRPATDQEGRLVVAIAAVGRQAEDIQQFVDQLEAKGSFKDLVTRSETTDPQGLLQVALEGRYEPGAPPKRVAPAASPARKAPGRRD
jgi:Tfp pilus assembly protein PilN